MEEFLELIGMLMKTISVNKEFSSLIFTIGFLSWISKTILDFALNKQDTILQRQVSVLQQQDSELQKLRSSIEVLIQKHDSCKFKG